MCRISFFSVLNYNLQLFLIVEDINVKIIILVYFNKEIERELKSHSHKNKLYVITEIIPSANVTLAASVEK